MISKVKRSAQSLEPSAERAGVSAGGSGSAGSYGLGCVQNQKNKSDPEVCERVTLRSCADTALHKSFQILQCIFSTLYFTSHQSNLNLSVSVY